MKRGIVVLLLFVLLFISSCEKYGPLREDSLEKELNYDCKDPLNDVKFLNDKRCYSLDDIEKSARLQENLLNPNIEKVFSTKGLDYDTKEFKNNVKFWGNFYDKFNFRFFFTDLADSLDYKDGSYNLDEDYIGTILFDCPDDSVLKVVGPDKERCLGPDKLNYKNLGEVFFNTNYEKILGSSFGYVSVKDEEFKVSDIFIVIISAPSEYTGWNYDGNTPLGCAACCSEWEYSSCGEEGCSNNKRSATRFCWNCGDYDCEEYIPCTFSSLCCDCNNWQDSVCGFEGTGWPCDWYEMKQTRSCNPLNCLSQFRCVDSGTCGCTSENPNHCSDSSNSCCGADHCLIDNCCGNGEIETGEECDVSIYGEDFGGETCEYHGFFTGSLACELDCTFDTSSCNNCGNGELDEGEECDLGEGNVWHDSTCLPNCNINEAYNEVPPPPLARQTTTIPCDFDSDELNLNNPLENYFCEHQLYLGEDYDCEEGYNIWVAGCIDSTSYDNTGQNTQCDECQGSLLVEYWCDQNLINSDGTYGAVVKDWFDCSNLMYMDGNILPDTENAWLSCQTDGDGALPACLGLPEPPETGCSNGITDPCAGETCYLNDEEEEVCAPKNCLNCAEDCGFCWENGYCDDGTNNRPDAGEHCATDCCDPSEGDHCVGIPDCLDNADVCDSCIVDGICNDGTNGNPDYGENVVNSPDDCAGGYFNRKKYARFYGEDDFNCDPEKWVAYVHWLNSNSVSYGDCSWTWSESSSGCRVYAIEGDDWPFNDDCANAVSQFGVVYNGVTTSSDAFEWCDHSIYDSFRSFASGPSGDNDAKCLLSNGNPSALLINSNLDHAPAYLCARWDNGAGALYGRWHQCGANSYGNSLYDPQLTQVFVCNREWYSSNSEACANGYYEYDYDVYTVSSSSLVGEGIGEYDIVILNEEETNLLLEKVGDQQVSSIEIVDYETCQINEAQCTLNCVDGFTTSGLPCELGVFNEEKCICEEF